MGLSGNYSNKTFVTFIGGKFCIKTDQEDPEGVARKNKNDVIVYEKYYTQLEGMITDLKFEKKDKFGNFIVVDVTDDENQTYVLQIPFDNFNLRDSFLKRLPNVDQNKPVKIVVFNKKSKDRKYSNTTLGISQLDEDDVEQWVAQKFTKDKPNGMPEPVEKIELGEKTLDWTPVKDFLYQVLLDEIKRFEPAPF